MIKNEIVNVVATASLNQPVDFDELRKYGEIFHDSDVYSGRVAYFKAQGMKGKVSIFFTGKMISVGTKSEAQAYKELELAAKFVIDKGLAKAIRLRPKTQNLVVVANFGKSIDLEKLSERTRAIYEPEQFPGVILRQVEPFRKTILLFASGKAVITGLKSSQQIEPTIQQLKQLIDVDF